MATLTSTKIKNTYDALLKSIDNDAIGTTAKQITDGLGNVTPLYISTTQIGIGVTPESGLNLHVFGDAKIGSNLTVIGNLVVEGSTTTVGTDTLTVKDPLIVLANNNTSTDAVDIGFYGKYTPSGTTLYSGLFREALTGKYRLFKDLQVEPTTTVNTSGTGYAQATLIASLEGNVTGNLTGNVTGGTISGTTGTFSGNVDIDGTLDVDDVISVEGSAFGRIEIGGASGGYIDLKAPNSDDYDLRIITSSGGNEVTTATGDLIFNTAETLSLTIDTSQDATFQGDIILSGTVDGRDVATDGAKLDGIEAGADVTDATNVLAAGAVMTTGNQSIGGVKTFSDQVTIPATPSASTDAASKGYVDAAVEGQDTLAEILANGNTTGGTDIAVSAGDDITFVDDSKAIFGSDGDLEIYHYSITDTAQITINGELDIRANTLSLKSYVGETMLRGSSNGAVRLYYDGVEKFITTSTGISVTGGGAFTDNISIVGDVKKLQWIDTEGNWKIESGNGSNKLVIHSESLVEDYLTIKGTGVIQLNDYGSGSNTGTATQRLGVDSSGNIIEIPIGGGAVDGSGTANTVTMWSDADTITDAPITISGNNATFAGNVLIQQSASTGLVVERTGATGSFMSLKDSSSSVFIGNINQEFVVQTPGSSYSTKLIISSSGNVGIGTTSPTAKLQLESTNAGAATVAGFLVNSSTTTNTETRLAFAAHTNSDIATNRYSYISTINTSGSNGQDMVFATNETGASAVERMRIDSSGKSTFYSNEIEVYSSSSSASLILNSGNATKDEWTIVSTDLAGDAYLRFVDTTTATTVMSLRDNGNVGIGTNDPRSRLHVAAPDPTTNFNLIDFRNPDYGIYAKTNSINARGNTLEFTATDYNISGTAVTRDVLTLRPEGNVGIGTTSPISKFSVVGDDNTNQANIGHSTQAVFIKVNGTNVDYNSSGNSGGSHTFSTGNTERMRIDSSGNVGIGGSANDGYRLQVLGTSQDSTTISMTYVGVGAGALKMTSNGAMAFGVDNADGSTERMRITSGGSLLVGGQTSTVYTEKFSIENTTASQGIVINQTDNANANDKIIFRNTNGIVGYIRTTGSSTSYNTSSDYRLKENVVEITGALDRVSQLKPSRFNFIADADKTVDGFLAHEVQEIVPEAITGEKDGMRTEEYEVSPDVYEDVVHPAEEAVYETIEHPAVEEELDDEGNVVVEAVEAYTEEVLVTEAKEEWTEKVLVTEKVMGTREVPDYQGIDQSKLVPLLVGAIQELKAEIESLKLQINN